MPTGIEQQPAPRRREVDQDALEEIRELFARYRRLARHGMATERDEPPGDTGDSSPGRAGDAGRGGDT
jgi:hypothetical protein